MAERVRDLRIHHPRSAVLRYISVQRRRLRRRSGAVRQSLGPAAEVAAAAADRQEVRAQSGRLSGAGQRDDGVQRSGRVSACR